MNIHDKEAKFHDEWAQSESPERLDVRRAFEAPTAMENQFILRLMGNLSGKRILDVGSGLGESSVYFALKGAEVTSTDLSPKMIECTQALARRYGVQVSTAVGAAEALKLEDDHFDFIYVANLVHHVQDKAALFHGLNRVLKPGGIVFFWDPLKYNPVINIYRRMATHVRTDGERPLGTAELSLMRAHFTSVQSRSFWLASLMLFLKYFLVDRLSPNACRYWRRILGETAYSLWWWRPFQGLDSVLLRVPGLRWLAWNMVVWGRKKP